MADLIIEKLDKLEKLIIEMKEGNEGRFLGMDQRFDGMDKRFDGIDIRLDGMDKRFDGIDIRLDGMDKRFDGIDIRLDGMDKRFDGIDKTLLEHEKLLDIVARKTYDIDKRLISVEENMATKSETRRIWRSLDTLAITSARHNEELIYIKESIKKIEIKLEEHDKVLIK
jgi:hypothetical protein